LEVNEVALLVAFFDFFHISVHLSMFLYNVNTTVNHFPPKYSEKHNNNTPRKYNIPL
jgi:hypothetical protein